MAAVTLIQRQLTWDVLGSVMSASVPAGERAKKAALSAERVAGEWPWIKFGFRTSIPGAAWIQF